MQASDIPIALGVAAIGGAVIMDEIFKRRRGQAVPPEAVAATFPGALAVPGQIERRGKALYRVNQDGQRVPLKWWSYDDNTGEFYRIKKKIGSRVLIESGSFDRRWATFHGKTARERRRIILQFVVFAVTAAAFSLLRYVGGDGPFAQGIKPVFLWLFFVPMTGAAVWNGVKPMLYQKATLIGPEPLKLRSADLGPSSVAHAVPFAAASSDLAYKPNE